MKSCHIPYATELALDRVPQNMDMCELKNRNQHAACGESSMPNIFDLIKASVAVPAWRSR